MKSISAEDILVRMRAEVAGLPADWKLGVAAHFDMLMEWAREDPYMCLAIAMAYFQISADLGGGPEAEDGRKELAE